MLKLISLVILTVNCATSTFLSPEASGLLVTGFLKSLGSPIGAPIGAIPPISPVSQAIPIGAPIAPAVGPIGPIGAKGGCPLCDRSVYSYCSENLIHDACCCGPRGSPFECPIINDCSFLHANSCYEHSLIVTCCCNNPYH